MNPLKLMFPIALALLGAAPAAYAKDLRVTSGRAVVKHVNASTEGRLALSAAPAGCSGPARLVIKRRGRVVLRARLSSKRTKALKGSRLAAGRHRLVLRVQGSRLRGGCKPRVTVKRLRVAPAARHGQGTTDADDPGDADDSAGPDGPDGPDEAGGPPPPLPGEDAESNEDAEV